MANLTRWVAAELLCTKDVPGVSLKGHADGLGGPPPVASQQDVFLDDAAKQTIHCCIQGCAPGKTGQFLAWRVAHGCHLPNMLMSQLYPMLRYFPSDYLR